jgi:hypothetical protein
MGIKRPESEGDYSPPSRAEVKNVWSYTCTPQYVFMVWCLVKHRDNFTFTFIFSVGTRGGKRALGEQRHRWEDDIKVHLRKLGYEDVDWVYWLGMETSGELSCK